MIHLDWVCGAMALLSTYTLGKKKWYGWLISAATNALFVWLNTRAHLYGVVPVSALCCLLNLWNMVKWIREKKGMSTMVLFTCATGTQVAASNATHQ